MSEYNKMPCIKPKKIPSKQDTLKSIEARVENRFGDARSNLIKLAARILLHAPSTFIEDYDLPKTTPLAAKRAIIKLAGEQSEKQRRWAIELRQIADSLKEGDK